MEDLLAVHRKEKKEFTAKTQKLKHGVPKGDKKKKKEVTEEITRMLAELELRHQNEIEEFKNNTCSTANLEQQPEFIGESDVMNVENSLNSYKSTIKSSKNVSDEQESSKNVDIPRLSKAQKRRNKKAVLEKERNEAIAAQEIENLNSLRNLEAVELNKKLSERCLTIYEVPSDGNCLYKAVEHQLLSLKLQKQTTVISLRESTSNYMLTHMDDFIPFLTCPDTGDILTEEQYLKYCEDIAKTCVWGGHTEIQALSHVCGAPIEIIQAKGPSIFAGNEYCNPKLILSYHRYVYGLGEHYNSVIPVPESDKK